MTYDKALRPRVGGLGLLHQRAESRAIGGGHIRQNLAIQIDAGLLQTVDELAVGDIGGAASGSDANNPQRAEIALLAAAADKAIAQSLLDGLLRGPIQFALGEKIARRSGQRLVAVVPAFGPAFYSRHVFTPRLNLAGGNGTCGAVPRNIRT